MMKRPILIFCAFLMLISQFLHAQQKTVSIKTELERFYDLRQLPQYLNDTHEWQKSSYDTTGGNDDGFSGKYSFVRKNGDGTSVIFEAKGKGVINRIWTPTPTDDTLDFYFDGKKSPTLSIKFIDLFTGKIFPFIKPLSGNQLGGYYCYLPMPFQNGCKIVYRGKKMQFYQVQCRSYPDSYTVKTFNPELSGDEKAELNKISVLWDTEAKTVKDFYKGDVKVAVTNATIKAGQTVELLNLQAGGRIVGIELDPASAFAGLDKQIDLKITWDGETTPAIYAPVADFFGYAFGSASMQSLLMGSAKGTNYCYFPMPFDKSAKIELVYRSADGNAAVDDKSIHAKIYYTNEKRNAATEGKFYAYWNSEMPTVQGQPHTYLQANGKGKYVGVILQAQGLRPGMTTFFEGDDSTATDGMMRIHGTGSEDSFNGGWYALMDRWDTKMSLPLHGALDYSLPFSRTGGYRLFLNDAVPYNKQILATMEHGPEMNDVPANYVSVALYYADKPASAPTAPSNKLTRIYLPDTLIMYPQLMNFGIWGAVKVDNTFSGAVVTAGDNDASLRISLAELPYGNYKLYADIKTTPDGADVSFWQRQTQLTDWITTNSPTEAYKKQVYICDITIGDFKNSVTVNFKTKGNNNKFAFSRLIFVKGNKK